MGPKRRKSMEVSPPKLPQRVTRSMTRYNTRMTRSMARSQTTTTTTTTPTPRRLTRSAPSARRRRRRRRSRSPAAAAALPQQDNDDEQRNDDHQDVVAAEDEEVSSTTKAVASSSGHKTHVVIEHCNENPAFGDKAKEVLEGLVESLDHYNIEVHCNPYPTQTGSFKVKIFDGSRDGIPLLDLGILEPPFQQLMDLNVNETVEDMYQRIVAYHIVESNP